MKNKPGKLTSMLEHFSSGIRLHRFQAEKLGDHCLPTTVSDLQKKHQIYFQRQTVKVPNRFGSVTSVSEYWLGEQDREKASRILRAA